MPSDKSNEPNEPVDVTEITEQSKLPGAGFEALHQRELVLAHREQELAERVRALDAQHDLRMRQLEEGQRKVLLSAEAREAACTDWEQILNQRDRKSRERAGALEKRAEELRQREEEVARAEQERDAGYVEARRALDQELAALRQGLERRAEALRQREAEVLRSEQERDAGFAESRRELERELHEARREAAEQVRQLRQGWLADLQAELDEERARRRKALSAELASARDYAQAELLATRKAFDEERTRVSAALASAQDKANQRTAELAAKESDLDYQQKALKARETKLQDRQQELELEVQRRVAHRQSALDAAERQLEERKVALDAEVEECVGERRQSFEKKEETLKAELSRLRAQIQGADKLLGVFELLKKQLGGRDAEKVLAELLAQEAALRDLREQITLRSPVMREEFEHLRAERDQLVANLAQRTTEVEALQGRMRGEDSLRRELQAEQARSEWLTKQKTILDGHCNQLTDELKRLRSAYEREEDREARIRDIETPDQREIPRLPQDAKVDELEWLQGIDQACIAYGLRFHPRILRSFHTALKTAEWSPLTVLAGVSGTGKSELPRLYAHFGGMTFKSLSVQPNWDSQESMLGFFNSIDNKFDAQPVLRLLAQSQKPWTEENHGLRDSIVMILLDEMNLAHAELYFAEFLSKLELRRGCKGDVPALEVKLGAGLLPYALQLGRNVLWAGTMNQDETTKALSDKVLDRSIVIHFPRPARLERRRELRPLPTAAPLLPRKVWESWWTRQSHFSEEQIGPFKAIIEDINEAMSKVGRALGHRVWQSVEYYMANYPDTLAAQRHKHPEELRRAMRDAFEDQLVQKVMPKLRGIDTRGQGKTACLDKIRDCLDKHEYHSILADFDLSCECGYGQFIWQTVSFLTAATAVDVPAPDPQGGASAQTQPTAPEEDQVSQKENEP